MSIFVWETTRLLHNMEKGVFLIHAETIEEAQKYVFESRLKLLERMNGRPGTREEANDLMSKYDLILPVMGEMYVQEEDLDKKDTRVRKKS